MEFNLIKIEKSFNKKSNLSSKHDSVVDLKSTSNRDIQIPTLVNSHSQVSSTATNVQDTNFTIKTPPKPSLLRDIFVGAVGTIAGSIVTYLIFGIQ